MTINPNFSNIQKKYDILLLKESRLVENPAIVYKILNHVNAYVCAIFEKEVHLIALQKFFGTRAYKQMYLLMNDIIKQYILSYELFLSDKDSKLVDLKNELTSKKSISESILYFFILYFTIVVEMLENADTNSVVDKHFLIKISDHYYSCYDDRSAIIIYLVSSIQFKYNLLDCLQIFNNVNSFCSTSRAFPLGEKYINESPHNNPNIDVLKFKSYNYLLDLTFYYLPFFAIERNFEHSDQLSGTRIKVQFKDLIDTNADITNKEFWYRKLESGIQDNKKRSAIAEASKIQKSYDKKANLTKPLNNRKNETLNPKKNFLSNKLQIYEKFQENHPHINVQTRITQLSNIDRGMLPAQSKKVKKTDKTKNRNVVQIAIHYLLKYQKNVNHRKLFLLLITLFAALAVALKKYSSYFLLIFRKLFS